MHMIGELWYAWNHMGGYDGVVLFNRTVSYSYYDSDLSGLAANVSNGRLDDSVGYYHNHVLSVELPNP